jgi:hypothetical protein
VALPQPIRYERNRRRLFHRLSGIKEIDGGSIDVKEIDGGSSTAYQV